MPPKKQPSESRPTERNRASRSDWFELTLATGVDPAAVGKWLRDIREQVGMTQFALAEKLGAHYQNLSRLETGREPKREPMMSTISGYLRALGWELVLVARPRTRRGRAEIGQ